MCVSYFIPYYMYNFTTKVIISCKNAKNKFKDIFFTLLFFKQLQRSCNKNNKIFNNFKCRLLFNFNDKN